MYEIFYVFPRKTQKGNSEVLIIPKVWSKPVVVGYQPLFRQEVPYCETRSIVTLPYHHKRITIMVLYEQVQEQEEKKCIKAM